jgi:hypothetical protein
VLRQITEVLERYGVAQIALTGGLAFGVWATPRFTRDFDLCASVPEEAVDKLLARFDGIRVGPGRIPQLIRFSFGEWDVDLFVATTEYDRECLARAVSAEVVGLRIGVVTAEDLLIHKLIKLRDDKRKLLQDGADIRQILEARGAELDHAHLRRWLPPEHAELLAQASHIDDAELVAALTRL